MIDTQQQYIKLNIHSEVSIIVVQAHSSRKRDICTYTYTHMMTSERQKHLESTDAIRKRHFYIHISRLMQSENGILLLFYIFLSHGNENKTLIYLFLKKKRGRVSKGGMVCPVPKHLWEIQVIVNGVCLSIVVFIFKNKLSK
jgi:hypothetical protein